ncbi:MAG: hypothetical protein ACO1RX_03720 [Candidatus Sericytochromatia bacterium]
MRLSFRVLVLSLGLACALSAPLQAAEAELLTAFVHEFAPLPKLPGPCCPALSAERPIPESYAPLLESANPQVWVEEPFTWSESIADYQFGYRLFDNADVTAVIVFNTRDENSKRYNLFELWSFHRTKGLVNRLELAGDDVSVMLSDGSASYNDLSALLFADGYINRTLIHRDEAGMDEDRNIEKIQLKQRYKLDLKTGAITLGM